MATIKDYFDIQELVCKHVYEKHKQKAWQFFDQRLLDVMLVIREKLGKPIYVNSWQIGGKTTQRGFRCNLCQLVQDKTKLNQVYVSAHMQGQALDFEVKGMTAEQTRQWIISNQILLPHPVRLERNVSWVHLDVRSTTSGVTMF